MTRSCWRAAAETLMLEAADESEDDERVMVVADGSGSGAAAMSMSSAWRRRQWRVGEGRCEANAKWGAKRKPS